MIPFRLSGYQERLRLTTAPRRLIAEPVCGLVAQALFDAFGEGGHLLP